MGSFAVDQLEEGELGEELVQLGADQRGSSLNCPPFMIVSLYESLSKCRI